MFGNTTNHRLMLGLLLVATVGFLTPTAEAKVRISFGYHGGHHAYHKYRSHYGHHGYSRHYGNHRYHHNRGHHRYRSHRAYRHARSRYYHRRYILPRYHRSNTARIVATPQRRRTTARYPTTDTADTHESETRRDSRGSTVHDGWRLFRDGAYDRAFNAFGRAAASHPKQGEPKLGYALAAAMRGDDDRAAFAMRRALRFEPEVLDQPVPISDETLQKLIAHYEYQDDEDGALMLRALKRLEAARKGDSRDDSSPQSSSGDDPY